MILAKHNIRGRGGAAAEPEASAAQDKMRDKDKDKDKDKGAAAKGEVAPDGKPVVRIPAAEEPVRDAPTRNVAPDEKRAKSPN